MMRMIRRLNFKSHAELVQLATDLLSMTNDAQTWLEHYDAALAAENDQSLVQFCRSLNRRLAGGKVPPGESRAAWSGRGSVGGSGAVRARSRRR